LMDVPLCASCTLSLHDALPILEFTIGGQTFSAQVTSISATTIVVKSPAVPNSVLTSEACDVDGDGTPGTRYIATSATVKVTSPLDRKSTRLNSSHVKISYAVFC